MTRLTEEQERVRDELQEALQGVHDRLIELENEAIQLRASRDSLVRWAAQSLPKRVLIELTGLSGERIRQITKHYPVSWARRVTVQRRELTDGQ